MREIDTEAPVVWPAWCYSGDGPDNESTAGTLPPSLPAAPVRARGKRRTTSNHHGNHQGNHHPNQPNQPNHQPNQLNHQPNHQQNHQGNHQQVTATPLAATMNGGDQLHHHLNNNNNTGGFNNNNSSNVNNNNSVNNNHGVKSERLSPGRAILTPDNQSSASRSRSVTPSSSSYPGTPPQQTLPDRGPSPAHAHAQATIRHMEQVMGRNCSDFIRSLAAKYNNANPNDYFSAARNGFPALDPRFSGSPFKTGSPFPGLLAPLLPGGSGAPGGAGGTASPSPSTSSQRGSPPQINTSLRDSVGAPESPKRPQGELLYPGIPFPPGMFRPLIDMSSTQALVQMMRAAKEDQIQSLLKDPSSISPSASLLHSPPSIPSPTSVNIGSKRSSSDVIPLDLSSAGLDKKPKLSHSTRAAVGTAVGTSASTVGASVMAGVAAVNDRCPGPPHCEGDAELAAWSVEDVCSFVGGIDICAEYTQNFRDQCIDGSTLPLLTEEHLTGSMGMKLGPALKLRAHLARRTGPSCPGCGGRKSQSQSAPQSPCGSGSRDNVVALSRESLSRESAVGNS